MSKQFSDFSSTQIVQSAEKQMQQQVRPSVDNVKPTDAHIDAISQLFTELELAYHNQFHKAFPDHQSLTLAKQLWLRVLADLSADNIIRGGRQAICNSDFLPTLNTLRRCAEATATAGIPDVKTAYYEACKANGEKLQHAWTHPIVYHAGQQTGWYLLKNYVEQQSFPIFEYNYGVLLDRMRRGEELTLPVFKSIANESSKPLDTETKKAKLQSLRESLEL